MPFDGKYALGPVFGFDPNYPQDVNAGFHFGWDWPLWYGTPVLAVTTAPVIFRGLAPFGYPGVQPWAWGNYVEQEPHHGVRIGYAHLRSIAPITPGQVLAAGETLGWSGDTGLTRGPHLHLQVLVWHAPSSVWRRVDPTPYF